MLRGIDISKWQSVGTGDQAADFVICKATEGTGYVDPSCDKHYQRAKQQGKLLGAYHFARPDKNSAEAEAEFFVKNVKGYIKHAILVLDWEWLDPNNKGPWLNPSWAKRWLDKVYELTGVRPLIYMSATVINDYGLDWSAVAKDYGLWIAGYPNKYNVKNPPEPTVNDMPYKIGAWKFWVIWQYTSSAGTLDRDIANIDRTAWMKYANPGGTTPAPTPAPDPVPAKKSVDQIADEVIAGKWGNGQERKDKLEAAGYNYNEVQAAVNKKLGINTGTTISYAVRKGDTLSSIAARYGTTWQKIAKDNNLSNPNLIIPGQRLIIKK